MIDSRKPIVLSCQPENMTPQEYENLFLTTALKELLLFGNYKQPMG